MTRKQEIVKAGEEAPSRPPLQAAIRAEIRAVRAPPLGQTGELDAQVRGGWRFPNEGKTGSPVVDLQGIEEHLTDRVDLAAPPRVGGWVESPPGWSFAGLPLP